MPYFVFDRVMCIKSDFWPPVASSFVSRCKSWSEPCILKDIIRNGCHLVPSGHKLGIHEKEEWRISFAMAEKNVFYEPLSVFIKQIDEIVYEGSH